MGAWGIGAFENDDAADMVMDVVDGGGLERLKGAIAAVLEAGDEYLEAPIAAEGLAAAEIIALWKNGETVAATEAHGLADWLKSNKAQPSTQLIASARQAIERVLRAPSELLELWSETDESTAWKANAAKTTARL